MHDRGAILVRRSLLPIALVVTAAALVFVAVFSVPYDALGHGVTVGGEPVEHVFRDKETGRIPDDAVKSELTGATGPMLDEAGKGKLKKEEKFWQHKAGLDSTKAIQWERPSNSFNCFYWAFSHRLQPKTPRVWITWRGSKQFLNQCSLLAPTDRAQYCDIVVWYYTNANNKKEFVHAGHVRAVDSVGRPTTVTSKWGSGSVYEHPLDHIPPNVVSGATGTEVYRRR